MKTDMILLSENIFTAGSLGMVSGGVAIADNKILCIGSKEEVLALADEDTDVRDFGTKLITPGNMRFTCPFVCRGLYESAPYVGGYSSAEECAKSLYEYYQAHEDE